MSGSIKGRRKRLTQKELVASEPRCIYCTSLPDSLEHMPPIWMFAQRQRPKGMEYATCSRCNNGTREADLATGFMARLSMLTSETGEALFAEAREKLESLDQLLPGFREEVFGSQPKREVRLVKGGVVHDVATFEAKGPILANALTTFGAKLGMALYREHVGEALPLAGAVWVQPFLNGGLDRNQAGAMLSILPLRNTLRQGRREVSSQFSYAFNCDDRSILMALVSLHSNLHFLLLATSAPELYQTTVASMFVARVSPGKLLEPRRLADIVPPFAAKANILPGLPRPAARPKP